MKLLNIDIDFNKSEYLALNRIFKNSQKKF